MNEEILEGKVYEQELLKSVFDFESNNNVLVSLNLNLSVNNTKMTRHRFNPAKQ